MIRLVAATGRHRPCASAIARPQAHLRTATGCWADPTGRPHPTRSQRRAACSPARSDSSATATATAARRRLAKYSDGDSETKSEGESEGEGEIDGGGDGNGRRLGGEGDSGSDTAKGAEPVRDHREGREG